MRTNKKFKLAIRSLKAETAIHYSKKKAVYALLLLVPMSLFGIFLYLRSGSWFGIFTFLLFGFFCSIYVVQFFRRKPGLVLNKTGIIVSKGLFGQGSKALPWQDIEKERVVSAAKTSGRGGYIMLHYLELEHKQGKERVPIDNFELSAAEIERLVVLYRSARQQ